MGRSTCAANHVEIGTAETSPIEPTSARTISTATSSRVTIDPIPWPASLNSSSSGSDAPA